MIALIIFAILSISLSQIYEVKTVYDYLPIEKGKEYYLILTGKNSFYKFNSKILDKDLTISLSNGLFSYGNLILVEKGEKGEKIRVIKVKNPCISPLIYIKYTNLGRIKEIDPYSLLWLKFSNREINLDIKSIISYLKSKSLEDFMRSLSLSFIFYDNIEDLKITYCRDVSFFMSRLNYISKSLKILIIPDGFEDYVDVNVKLYINGKFINQTTFENVAPGESLEILLNSSNIILGDLLVDVSISKKVLVGGGIFNAPQSIKHLTIILKKGEEELLKESYILGSNRFSKVFFFDGGINKELKIGYKSDELLSIYLYLLSHFCKINEGIEILKRFIYNLDESSLKGILDRIKFEDLIIFYYLYLIDRNTAKINGLTSIQ